jgi:hypothetical protein
MWFWVWTLLILGSLVGAFLLARSLWRSARGLLEELGRASARIGESSDRLQELSDRAREAATQHAGPSLFDDVTIHYQRVNAQRVARATRKEARRTRHVVTWQKWKHFND